MKKIFIPLLTVAVLVSIIFAGCVPGAAPTPPVTPPPVTPPGAPVIPPPVTPPEVAEKFGLADIPEIGNKTPLHIIIEAGAFCDKIIPYFEDFSEATGVPTSYETHGSIVLYSKQMPEIMARTGWYDLLYIETAWTVEFTQFTYRVEDLANQYDPGGWEAALSDIQFQSPALMRCCSDRDGNVSALPYYCYDMTMWFRQDVFDDPTEQASFKAKYGYDLAPADTQPQLRDQAEFFTRKKGELLKGEVLDHDVWGVGMMAGAYQINDEISSRIWGKGSDYATVVRDADGNVVEFVITKRNKEILIETMTEYIDLLQFASPGCLTANYDFPCAEFAEGRCIILPTEFVCIVNWAIGDMMAEKMPEARVGFYPTIGRRPYTGCWSQGVCLDSKNPEAAYWLSRYLGSYEVQMALTLDGWPTTRMDVLADPIFFTPELIHPAGLVNQYCIDIWEETAGAPHGYYYFNTLVGGKVYEMQMDVLHKAVSGERTIEGMVRELVDEIIMLETKFGDIPIREE